MSTSHRHHYVPQFFTKGFADDDGLLYIYDKEKDQTLNQKKSPKSIFYKWDRNTVELGGKPCDNLEKLYAAKDNLTAGELNAVLNNEGLTPERLTSLVYLASDLKWRTTKHDDQFDRLKGYISQQDLGINISLKPGQSDIAKMVEHIENSPIYRESKRAILPFLALRDSRQFQQYHTYCRVQVNPKNPALIGDNPVLERPNDDFKIFDDFILPLNHSYTLIFKKGLKQGIGNAYFFLQRDLAMLSNADRYIGCRDKRHLEMIVAMFRKIKMDQREADILKYLFEYIT